MTSRRARSAVVLIDEVDKAPRDSSERHPGALDQTDFEVPEGPCGGSPQGNPIGCAPSRGPAAPCSDRNQQQQACCPNLARFVAVSSTTSSSPRIWCRAVGAARKIYPQLDDATVDAAIRRFLEMPKEPAQNQPPRAAAHWWCSQLKGYDCPDPAF